MDKTNETDLPMAPTTCPTCHRPWRHDAQHATATMPTVPGQPKPNEKKRKIKAWSTRPDGYYAAGQRFGFQEKQDVELTESQIAELKNEPHMAFEDHGEVVNDERHATDLKNAPAARPLGVGGDEEDPKKGTRK